MSRDRHKRISINAPRYKRMGHGVRPDPKPEDSDCSLSSSSQSSGESTRTKVNFSSRGLAGFRLVRIPIAIIFIFSLFIFFAWSLVEVLLELFNISFPKPIVHQVIFLGILLLLSIIYILGAIKVINQGYEAIVERLGRFTKILKPGIHLVNPILDIVLVDSLREQGLDTSLQPIFTKDNELIKVSSFVLWKILDVSIASYAIENLESYLLALVRTSTSNEIAQMDLREALSLRSKINEKVLNVLEEATLAWGIKIIRVEIQEMRLSQSLLTAFEAERSAEILNRAGILGAEGKKHVAIQEAEIRHLVAIQDTNTEIEISKLRIEAYKAGILLSKQQEEELREEEKAKREFEQAQKEAEKEEANYQKALDKARKEMELATGEKHDKLQAQIERLEQELKAAQEKKERALSMAQQTKRGHVYIISNIGSFGENVYKIGMTRRLEPTDRIRELGDASVPYLFDIHAMIYSDEARTLEYELHKAFTNKKVNMLNYRKEFFNVTLDEIEQQIKTIGIDAEFSRLPEAMEYRETLAILERLNSRVVPKTVEEIIADEFPSTLTA